MNSPLSWSQKQQQDFYEDQREIMREKAKAYAREQAKIEAMKYRIAVKESEAERKKSVYNEVQLLSSGEMQIVTKNLRVDAQPRHFTNMRAPHLTVLKRMGDELDEIILFKCKVENHDIEVYMDADMLGNGTRLVRKLAAKGVYFELPSVEAKKAAVRIIGILLHDDAETKWLPEYTGWMKESNGNFVFVEEGELTWQNAKKLAK